MLGGARGHTVHLHSRSGVPAEVAAQKGAVTLTGYVSSYGAKLAAAAAGEGAAEQTPPTPALGGDGLELARRIDLAEGALRGMSLTTGFLFGRWVGTALAIVSASLLSRTAIL